MRRLMLASCVSCNFHCNKLKAMLCKVGIRAQSTFSSTNILSCRSFKEDNLYLNPLFFLPGTITELPFLFKKSTTFAFNSVCLVFSFTLPSNLNFLLVFLPGLLNFNLLTALFYSPGDFFFYCFFSL